MARSLDGHSVQYNTPFPHLNSDPAVDHVNPGIGHIVNLFETIVPMRGQSLHSIEKKVEERNELPPIVTKNDELKIQIGSGQDLDPDVLNSFKHPIVTDSIEFPKVEINKKHKLPEDSKSVSKKLKKSMAEHKFQVI